MYVAPREAYPLTWPTGRVRTPPYRRRRARFQVAFGCARDELMEELRRLGAASVVVSTGIPLKRNGLPHADYDEPGDPGVAVYFDRRRTPFVIACDTYSRVAGNLRAIGLTVEALRTIERHGSTEMMEQAFTGFAALPPARVGEPSWWDVLGVSRGASLAEIEAAHRRLLLQHHPDAGGGDDEMARINRARDVARSERG